MADAETINYLVALGPTAIPAIVSAFSAVTVAIISVRDGRTRKREDKLRKDEEELKTTKIKEEEAERKRVQDSIDGLAHIIAEIQRSIEEINQNYQEQQQGISELVKLSKMNGLYTHEVGQLSVVMAEGLRDNHFDGNITRALTNFQKFKDSTIGNILIPQETLHS